MSWPSWPTHISKFCSRFFEVCTYSSIAIHNFGLEVSPCKAISEGRPPLRDRSSEAEAMPLEVRIENDSDRQFSKSKFFDFFWKPVFTTFHASLFIVSLKLFFRFLEVCNYPLIHNFGLEASPCNAISEGRPRLSNTTSEAGALPL